MKKITPTLLALALLFMVACSKKSDPAPAPPNNNNNNNNTNPYYFKFTFRGVNYNMAADFPEYTFLYPNIFGGYQEQNGLGSPSIALRMIWPDTAVVHDADVMALKGKTFYYNDTPVHPELEFDSVVSADGWYAADTSDHSYSVTISNVVYLKKDTAAGYPISTYVITGTCSAVMFFNYAGTPAPLTNGQFNFIVSRQDN